MPRMQFGTSAFERARGDLPELPVINLYAEEAPTEETGIALQSRPGLSDRSADMGMGPVEALFKKDGVLSGALFGISAGGLYSATTLVGTVAGSGAVSIAGNESGLMVTAGADIYLTTDGTTLSAMAFPDGADVAKVFNGASRFFAIRKDTGKIYFTDPLATDVDALDFATAESLPDKLVDGLWLDDAAILGGAESVEIWPNTDDADLPIAPLEGAVIARGVRATGCMAVFGENWAFVDDDNAVHIGSGASIERVSNPGLEAKIKASTACRLWTFVMDAQEFLCLRLDTQSYAFGEINRLWSEVASYGEDNWLPQCFAGGVFGSAADGKTLAFSSDHLDLAGQLERRFRAGFALNSGGLFIDNLILRCNVGQTPFLTGDYVIPVVEMRTSDDAGQTWSVWDAVSLGAQGDYRAQPVWDAVGMASQPGFLAEFRLTAPVPFRVSDVLINEPRGGR